MNRKHKRTLRAGHLAAEQHAARHIGYGNGAGEGGGSQLQGYAAAGGVGIHLEANLWLEVDAEHLAQPAAAVLVNHLQAIVNPAAETFCLVSEPVLTQAARFHSSNGGVIAAIATALHFKAVKSGFIFSEPLQFYVRSFEHTPEIQEMHGQGGETRTAAVPNQLYIFRMIHKGIAVALIGEGRIVARYFLGAHGILLVPFDHQLQVGYIHAGEEAGIKSLYAGGAAVPGRHIVFVAGHKIEEGAGQVALVGINGFKSRTGEAGGSYGAQLAAILGGGGGAGHFAVDEITAQGVHPFVGGEYMVIVGGGTGYLGIAIEPAGGHGVFTVV